MRAGTTSLFRDLRSHPQILPPVTKEIHYFDYHHTEGERWYRAHFPTRRERSRSNAITGEATPNYLAHPFAAEWAAQELPATKFVVLLRDPVARAFSHWKLMTRLGHETLPFADAIEREVDRIESEWQRLLAEPEYPAVDWFRYSYIARGRYAEQLERWFAHIDRSRFLVIQSERYYAEPAAVWEGITSFIGVSGWEPENFSNVHGTLSNGPDPSLAAELRTRLASHNARLAELVGGAFHWD